MARKSITYEEIRKLSPTELGKMSKYELSSLLRKVRIKTQDRFEQLEKVSESVYSPAADIFSQKVLFPSGKYQPTSRMSRNKMLSELFAHQTFHQAKTSTVKGAREVQREQDIRIFGAGKKGAPKKRMSLEQRIRFWKVYEEFNKTYKNKEYLYGSNRIQQALGQMISGNNLKSDNVINLDDFDTLLEMLEKSQREQEEQGSYDFNDANVYSGRWTD